MRHPRGSWKEGVRSAVGRGGFLALCALLAVGCKSDKPTQKLVITGSSTVAPLIMEMSKRFEAQNPGVRIDVQTGGSSRGVADARQGAADIGMASRDLKPDESDLEAHAIARDGICVITHRDNPVQALTEEQVVSIFTGQVTQWKDVGGPEQPITVVNKAEGRSTLELFLHHFKLKNSQVKAQVVIGDNQQGIKTIEGNPNAIGYVSVGAADYSIQNGQPIRALPLNGVAASMATLKDGTFPLSRNLNLVTRKGASGNELARKFITFAQSEAVHDLIEQQYFVPVRK